MSRRGRLHRASPSYRVCAVSLNSEVEADVALAALRISQLNASRYTDSSAPACDRDGGPYTKAQAPKIVSSERSSTSIGDDHPEEADMAR